MSIRSSLVVNSLTPVEVYRRASGLTGPVTAVITNLAAANEFEFFVLGVDDVVVDTPTVTNKGSGYITVPKATLVSEVVVPPVFRVHMELEAVTIRVPGMKYAVNDEVVLGGGTGTTQPVAKVSAVDKWGRVTAIAPFVRGDLYTLKKRQHLLRPTGGTGRGLLLSATYRVLSFDVATAGKTYVVRPIVSIEGPAEGTLALTLGVEPRHRLIRQELVKDELATFKDVPLGSGDILAVSSKGSVAVKVFQE